MYKQHTVNTEIDICHFIKYIYGRYIFLLLTSVYHNLHKITFWKMDLFYILVTFMVYWRICHFWLHRFYLWRSLALYCGRYKKKKWKNKIYNTHLDCKLCILLYLNLPKMCKAPHVYLLDSQLSVRITSLSHSSSDGREEDYIDENMKAGVLD